MRSAASHKRYVGRHGENQVPSPTQQPIRGRGFASVQQRPTIMSFGPMQAKAASGKAAKAGPPQQAAVKGKEGNSNAAVAARLLSTAALTEKVIEWTPEVSPARGQAEFCLPDGSLQEPMLRSAIENTTVSLPR